VAFEAGGSGQPRAPGGPRRPGASGSVRTARLTGRRSAARRQRRRAWRTAGPCRKPGDRIALSVRLAPARRSWPRLPPASGSRDRTAVVHAHGGVPGQAAAHLDLYRLSGVSEASRVACRRARGRRDHAHRGAIAGGRRTPTASRCASSSGPTMPGSQVSPPRGPTRLSPRRGRLMGGYLLAIERPRAGRRSPRRGTRQGWSAVMPGQALTPETVLPRLAALLTAAGATPGTSPSSSASAGGFTGLRVGLATAGRWRTDCVGRSSASARRGAGGGGRLAGRGTVVMPAGRIAISCRSAAMGAGARRSRRRLGPAGRAVPRSTTLVAVDLDDPGIATEARQRGATAVAGLGQRCPTWCRGARCRPYRRRCRAGAGLVTLPRGVTRRQTGLRSPDLRRGTDIAAMRWRTSRPSHAVERKLPGALAACLP
jgi:hypothetical protein